MDIGTIMVPLDGSEFSQAALPAAVEVARRAGAGLLLTYVHSGFPPARPGEAPESLVEADRELVRHEKELLEEVAAEVRESDVEVETLYEEGPVAETLSERAEERADLVLMATHGRGTFSRFWLGSVADELSRRCSVPMLYVRPGREGEEVVPVELSPERILVALDGSDLAEQALGPATAVGDLFDARYTVLRVIQPAVRPSLGYEELPVQVDAEVLAEQETAASGYVEEVAQGLRDTGHEAEGRVVHATSAAEEIVVQAREEEAGLVAMATHGLGGLKRLLLGSVADKVLRASDRPVLLYRPRESS